MFWRKSVLWLSLAVAGFSPSLALAQTAGEALIPNTAARRLGLDRVWFTQVAMDGARSTLANWTLADGMLLTQSTGNFVQGLDAETGRKLISFQAGPANAPSFAPVANKKYVAVVNTKQLLVFHRENGLPAWDATLRSAPLAGPAISDEWVYIPMSNGMIVGYRLEPPKKAIQSTEEQAPISWSFGTSARIETSLVVTESGVYWASYKGMLHGSSLSDRQISFQFEPDAPLSAPLSVRWPFVLMPLRNNEVYAVFTERGTFMGKAVWRFSVGPGQGEILEPVAPIDDKAFIIRDHHGMFAVDLETDSVAKVRKGEGTYEQVTNFGGGYRWYSAGITQFVAASAQRVYAIDTQYQINILSKSTGARLAVLPTNGITNFYQNTINDRMYLATEAGLIQCLRETESTTPLVHNQVHRQEAPAAIQGADPNAAPGAEANQN